MSSQSAVDEKRQYNPQIYQQERLSKSTWETILSGFGTGATTSGTKYSVHKSEI